MAGYRSKHRRRTDSGAAWISYSDMMAALLLLFVLVLCYSVYQYFVMLETKTTEIEEKAAQLVTQGDTLIMQEDTIKEQSMQLRRKTAELEDKEAIVAHSSIQLRQNQGTLLKQEETLALQEDQLAQSNRMLVLKEGELSRSQAETDENKHKLLQSSQIISDQRQALTTQQQRLEDLVGVKTQIIKELSQALADADLKATVDPNTGDIVLESTVFFDVGKNEIKQSGKELLDAFIPVYLSVLFSPEYEGFLGEIIIEGHTDTSGTYLMNLELSQDRALSVATYCLEMPGLPDEHRERLRTILTAKGRSYADPVYNEDGTVNMEASRRVEFKFSLRDAEMIEEIRVILDEEYGVELPLPSMEDEGKQEFTGGGEIQLSIGVGEEE